MQGLFPLDYVTVKLSAANMHLMFTPCGPECIQAGCNGNCCDAPTRPTGCLVTIHPSEQEKLERAGAVIINGLLQPLPETRGCPFKFDGLCKLHFTEIKPFGCIASPFTLNKNSTLIVRNRYKLLPCYRNKGPKLPAYKAYSSSLELLFGNEQLQTIINHFDMEKTDLLMPMKIDIYSKLIDNDLIKKQAP